MQVVPCYRKSKTITAKNKRGARSLIYDTKVLHIVILRLKIDDFSSLEGDLRGFKRETEDTQKKKFHQIH